MEVETQTILNNFDFSNEQFSSFPYGRIHQCSSASQLSLAPSTWEANDGLILDDKYPSSMDVNENALDQVTEESMLVDTDEAITTDGSRPSVKSMEDINGLDDTHSLEESSTDKAALKLQKVYRSYRTRRRLADSAVVAEELWWQAINYARLNHSTISFFNSPETVAERWARVKLNASVVGKGLSKMDNRNWCKNWLHCGLPIGIKGTSPGVCETVTEESPFTIRFSTACHLSCFC